MTTDTGMVERAARAAAKAAGNFDYDGFGADTRAKYDRIAVAVMDELWKRIEFALLDLDADGDEGFARGHAHAKNVVREILGAPPHPSKENQSD